MWILVHQPGTEPTSSALQGGFLTTGPPGKSPKYNNFTCIILFNLTHSSWDTHHLLCQWGNRQSEAKQLAQCQPRKVTVGTLSRLCCLWEGGTRDLRLSSRSPAWWPWASSLPPWGPHLHTCLNGIIITTLQHLFCWGCCRNQKETCEKVSKTMRRRLTIEY